MVSVKGEQTSYGFTWGNLEVDRLMSDDKDGWVCLGLSSDKRKLELYVTKTGKMRLYEVKDGRKYEIDIAAKP